MMPRTFTILSRADVAKVSRMRRPLPRLRIAGPVIADEQSARAVQDALNRHRNACGCTAGSIALVGIGALALALGTPWLTAAGYAFAGALVGKLLGVIAGRRAFRAWLSRAGELYSNRQEPAQ